MSTLPNWPCIQVYYFDQKRIDIGVKTVTDGENQFHIFDIEKIILQEKIVKLIDYMRVLKVFAVRR